MFPPSSRSICLWVHFDKSIACKSLVGASSNDLNRYNPKLRAVQVLRNAPREEGGLKERFSALQGGQGVKPFEKMYKKFKIPPFPNESLENRGGGVRPVLRNS